MRSSMPKVLHPLGGRPLVAHVLDTAASLNPVRIEVVVRHERDRVVEALLDLAPDVRIVDQAEVPGTGRAVQVALEDLGDFAGDVLVLSGDVPLLEATTLADLLSAHPASGAAATVLSTRAAEPDGNRRNLRATPG